MQAEVKYFHSPDVENLDTWLPSSPDFSILLQVMVGPVGSDGEESFDILVCGSAWLARQLRLTGIFDGNHCLVVEHFDWYALSSYLEQRVSEVSAPTWDEIALSLSQLGKWEFSDYR